MTRLQMPPWWSSQEGGKHSKGRSHALPVHPANDLGCHRHSQDRIRHRFTAWGLLIPILMALQHMYDSCKDELVQILLLVKGDFEAQGRKNCGCVAMSYWETLVLAAVPLGRDMDFDQLADLAVNNRKLRGMLGLSDWDQKKYSRSTIHENLDFLDPATIRAIRANSEVPGGRT